MTNGWYLVNSESWSGVRPYRINVCERHDHVNDRQYEFLYLQVDGTGNCLFSSDQKVLVSVHCHFTAGHLFSEQIFQENGGQLHGKPPTAHHQEQVHVPHVAVRC